MANARTRKKATLVVATDPTGAATLVLSQAGAVAWFVVPPSGSVSQLMASPLTGPGHGLGISPHQLDSGQISGLSFHGRTLSWTSGGVPRSETI